METEAPTVEPAATEEPLIGGAESLDGMMAAPAEEAVEPVSDDVIRIGDKEFTNQKEAWSYAQKLETERLSSDSYRQGIQDALAQQQAAPDVTNQPAEPVVDDFDERFYENPKQYLAEMAQQIRNEVKQEVSQESAQKAQERKLWKEFYSKNQDLQNMDSYVKAVMNENWDMLGPMKDVNKAMDILAQKSREKLQAWEESKKPQRELANAATPVTSSNQPNTPAKKSSDEAIDFVSQLRKLQDKLN